MSEFFRLSCYTSGNVHLPSFEKNVIAEWLFEILMLLSKFLKVIIVPVMVYVLPAPVCPYMNRVAL